MSVRFTSVLILVSLLVGFMLCAGCSTASHSYAITPPEGWEQNPGAKDAEFVFVQKGFNRLTDLSKRKDLYEGSPELIEYKTLKAAMEALPDPWAFISLSKTKVTPLTKWNMDTMLKKTEEYTNDPSKGSMLKNFVFDYGSVVKNPISGYPSRTAEAEFVLRTEKKKSLQLYVYREGYLYMVNCGCKPLAFEAMKPTFQQAVNSFKFLD